VFPPFRDPGQLVFRKGIPTPINDMREMTIVPKGTETSVARGIRKISARCLREIREVGLLDVFFAGRAMRFKGSAGDDVVRVFSAGGTCLVHIFEDCVD
jgi:hypothetical protein